MTQSRRKQLRILCLGECAAIIESAIGTDLGIYNENNLTKEEITFIECQMRRVSDDLYKKAKS